MRFLKLNTGYPAAERQFIADNPDLNSLSYEDRLARFRTGQYQVAHAFVPHLRSLAHDAHDTYVDVEALQTAWAHEHGIQYETETWARDILLAQVRWHEPDVVFLEDLLGFDRSLLGLIREASEGARLIGWLGVATDDPSILGGVDLVLSSAPNLVEDFRRKGASAEVFRNAFEESVLAGHDAIRERDVSFAFVGNVFNFPGLHAQRHDHIRRLLQETPLEVWGSVSDAPPAEGIQQLGTMLAFTCSKGLRNLGMPAETVAKIPFVRRAAYSTHLPGQPLVERFRNRMHPAVFGRSYFDLLSRTRVVFNSHVDAAADFAGNLRLFEATGMGACLLSDWKRNLSEFFEVGTEMIAYRTIDEAIQKGRFLLENPDEAARIGAAGQRRTLRDHTYRKRTQELLEILDKHACS